MASRVLSLALQTRTTDIQGSGLVTLLIISDRNMFDISTYSVKVSCHMSYAAHIVHISAHKKMSAWFSWHFNTFCGTLFTQVSAKADSVCESILLTKSV